MTTKIVTVSLEQRLCSALSEVGKYLCLSLPQGERRTCRHNVSFLGPQVAHEQISPQTLPDMVSSLLSNVEALLFNLTRAEMVAVSGLTMQDS
jgi:hypothetical protein